MLRYRCLVLDHDDTVVQTLKTLSYPFFCEILDRLRPGAAVSLEDYVLHCHNLGFTEFCRQIFSFTDGELAYESSQWTPYIQSHIPDFYPGMDRVIHRQIAEGGILCVVSHSASETILRAYRHHFGLTPHRIYGSDLPRHQQKPNPYPLEDIMTRYNLKPEEILVVDDMKLACAMAQPLGIDVAYANWGDIGVEALSREMEALCPYSFASPQALHQFLFQE